MQLTPLAQAVVLMTIPLKKADTKDAKPLTTREWAKFAGWLWDRGLDPEALLQSDIAALLSEWDDPKISLPRIQALLSQGFALGLASEKWQRMGLWLLTRSDPEYPVRLKQRLGTQSPPVLFGCGNKALLDKGGIAVVGSRAAGEEDISFTTKLGQQAARDGYSIVSGGARGVDQTAMLGALDVEGMAVGVLAENLLRAVTSAKYCEHIMAKNLTLITPFNPEARFHAGNAMARNRYIYCMADAAVVVSSTAKKGGTWAGAVENLKHKWVPLWVKPSSEGASGNPELTEKGGHTLPDHPYSLDTLFNGASAVAELDDSGDLLPKGEEVGVRPAEQASGEAGTKRPVAVPQASPDIFSRLLAGVTNVASAEPMKPTDIAAVLGEERKLVKATLDLAVDEESAKKFNRPVVRYQVITAPQPAEAEAKRPTSAPTAPSNIYRDLLAGIAKATSAKFMKAADIAEILDKKEAIVRAALELAKADGSVKSKKSAHKVIVPQQDMFSK